MSTSVVAAAPRLIDRLTGPLDPPRRKLMADCGERSCGRLRLSPPTVTVLASGLSLLSCDRRGLKVCRGPKRRRGRRRKPGRRAATPLVVRPAEAPRTPRRQGEAWVRNPVDAFILSEIEATGLSPAPEAEGDPDPPPSVRPDGAPPDPRGSRRVRQRHAARRLRAAGRPAARRPTSTASVGRGCGSTWPVTPRATGSRATRPGRPPGGTATGLSTL